MKTASHYTYTGPGRVCISRGAPRGALAGYRIFRTLAPTRDILGISDQEAYRKRFDAEVLGILDPQATWDHLHELAGEGNEPVIQCFERPPFTCTNWCHRRMVADWFKRELGHDVDELEPESKETYQANKSAAAARVKEQVQIPPSGQSSLFDAPAIIPAIPRRPSVEAVRTAIDAFWTRVCGALGIAYSWCWSALPNSVKAQLDSSDLDEWVALQDRYRNVY